MIDEALLEKATIAVLRSYLGVAAEFVAQDAIEQLRAGKQDSHLPDWARLSIFFIGLSGLLEKTLPFQQIRDQILKVYDGSR